MSFLGHVLHTFSHILGDVLPHFGPLEQQFGMTPGSGGTIANLIMQSEAGDPQAAEMLAQYQDPNQLEFIEHARGWLHGHPHYNTFLAHAGHPYGMAGRPSPFLRSGPVPHYAERHFELLDEALGKMGEVFSLHNAPATQKPTDPNGVNT